MSPTAAEALLTRIGRVDHLLRNGRDIGTVQAIELLGEVRAFIESAGADSERYRWLRTHPVQCSNFADDQTYGCTKDKPELFDAAIDSARARSTTPAMEPGK